MVVLDAVGAVAVGAGAVTYVETRPGPSNELVISGDAGRGAMSMLRIRRGILGLAVIPALVGAVGGCTTKEGPGLKVTIDRGDFQPAKMKVAISADHGGFAFQMRDNSMGVASPPRTSTATARWS